MCHFYVERLCFHSRHTLRCVPWLTSPAVGNVRTAPCPLPTTYDVHTYRCKHHFHHFVTREMSRPYLCSDPSIFVIAALQKASFVSVLRHLYVCMFLSLSTSPMVDVVRDVLSWRGLDAPCSDCFDAVA
jgi:hypothetical protein